MIIVGAAGCDFHMFNGCYRVLGMNRIIFAVLLSACYLSPARAQDAARFELTPFAGYRFGGTLEVEDSAGSFKLDDAMSYGLILNFPHRANTQWEVLYSKQSTEAEFSTATPNDSSLDIDLHILQLGGTYQFEGNKVIPYLAMTLGATHIKVSSTGTSSDTFWSGSIGLGILISPGSRVGVRLEARAYGTLTNSSTDLLCETGPDINFCAVRIEGDIVTQIEAFAGVVFRF